jgi:hypothetical protein
MKTTEAEATKLLAPFLKAMVGGVPCEIDLVLKANRPARFEVTVVCDSEEEAERVQARLANGRLVSQEWIKLYPINEPLQWNPRVKRERVTLQTTLCLGRRELIADDAS